jgi:hypothetical protein
MAEAATNKTSEKWALGNEPGEVSNTCGWKTEVKDTPQLLKDSSSFLRHKVNLFLSSHNFYFITFDNF